MKLSDYIKNLQEKLEKYGDGDVYILGECCEHETPYIEENLNEECVWNEKLQDVEWKIKDVKYRIFGTY